MALLLTVLGALLCSLMVSSQVQPMADFDVQQTAGRWYMVGHATNIDWILARRRTMKILQVTISPSAEGDLNLLYVFPSPGGVCWPLEKCAQKTQVPGQFMLTNYGWILNYYIADAKYDEYLLVNITGTKQGKITVVTKLLVRGVDVSDDLKEKFKQFSLEYGIKPENIGYLPKTEQCP